MPLRACTVWVRFGRRSRPPSLSLPVARLPVAKTLYSTWRSSTTTTGRRPGEYSVDAAIALLGCPEEDDPEQEDHHRPDRDDRPQLDPHVVERIGVQEQLARQAHEGVHRLVLDVLEHPRRVRE